MARDGSGNFILPAGWEGIPDHTIESTKYNAVINEFVTDANTARPVIYGGTGATNAVDARHNIGAEAANVQVTNYDSHPFESGTFWSAPGATGAPPSGGTAAGYFEGICYTAVPGFADFFVEVRSLDTSIKYMRRRTTTGWSVWTIADGSDKVAKSGDTMSGDLHIDKTSPSLLLNKTASGQFNGIWGLLNGQARWIVSVGDTAPEGGSNSGSDFTIVKATDGGAYNGVALSILRPTGQVNIPCTLASTSFSTGGLIVGGGIGANGQVTATNFNAVGGFPSVSMDATGNANLVYRKNGLSRWTLATSGGAESGGNVGSDLLLYRFNDAGSIIDTPFTIVRSNGTVTMSGPVNIGGNVNVNSNLTTSGEIKTQVGILRFNTAGDRYLYWDGTNWTLSGGGAFNISSNISTSGSIQAGVGIYYFQDATKNLTYSSGSFYLNGGNLSTSGAIGATSTITAFNGNMISQATTGGNAHFICQDETGAPKGYFYWNRGDNSLQMFHPAGGSVSVSPVGKVTLADGFAGRAGAGGALDTNKHNFNWTGSATQMWIDGSNFGNISTVCDYRIKKDVAPLDSTWDAVKALRPISYTQREFAPLFAENDDLQWGFLAHELQETLLPTAAHGKKDAEHEIQTPNLLAIVTALTKALQEAMERIEALEDAAR